MAGHFPRRTHNEETFVLASVKEFVKAWSSGNQANLNLQCKNGGAWLSLGFQLNSPQSPHHHGPPPHHHPRHRRPKGPARRERDRVRAMRHQAGLQARTEAASATGTPNLPTPQPRATSDLVAVRHHPPEVPSVPQPATPAGHPPLPAAAPASQSPPPAAVPAMQPPPPATAPASQAPPPNSIVSGDLPHLSPNQQVEAAVGQLGHGAASALADVFCPDSDYFDTYRAERERERQHSRDERARERQRDLEMFANSLKNML